jgi:hypothetical protein
MNCAPAAQRTFGTDMKKDKNMRCADMTAMVVFYTAMAAAAVCAAVVIML